MAKSLKCDVFVEEEKEKDICVLQDVKNLIANEIESLAPAVTERIWQPFSILKEEIKAKLRKLWVYIKNIAQETQSVGDAFGSESEEAPKSTESKEQNNDILQERLELLHIDLFSQMQFMIERFEEVLFNSTSQIEIEIDNLKNTFSLVLVKIQDLNLRLDALKQDLHC